MEPNCTLKCWLYILTEKPHYTIICIIHIYMKQIKRKAEMRNRSVAASPAPLGIPETTQKTNTLGIIIRNLWYTQSYPTLCDPMDCSPPGSSLHGTSQTRILVWAAISYFKKPPAPHRNTFKDWWKIEGYSCAQRP